MAGALTPSSPGSPAERRIRRPSGGFSPRLARSGASPLQPNHPKSDRLLDSALFIAAGQSNVQVVADPRVFPRDFRSPGAQQSAWYGWAEQGLTGATGAERDAADARLRAGFGGALNDGAVDALRLAFDGAPSASVYRYLQRQLSIAWQRSASGNETQLAFHGFAIPIVIVAGAAAAIEVPAVLDDVPAIASLLQEHGALGGNRTFGLANALAGADAVGIASLPRWLQWRATPDQSGALREVAPASLRIAAGQEAAHIAYLVGSALAAPRAALFDPAASRPWAMPLAQMLSRQLAVDGVQLLALPRSPIDPVSASPAGQLAQREIALQLFASNAIRELRAAFGEPTAVISAHRLDAGEGELRLSLSSPFGERDAAGFRCPLFAFERVEEVLEQIVELLRACRVSDIRVMSGVRPDRDPSTGLTLLFRADAIDPGESISYH